MPGKNLQISSRIRRQLLRSKSLERRVERGLLAAREPADVIVELLAALVDEMEHQQPRGALEGVGFLPREEHRVPRRQREYPEVVGLRMIPEVLQPILARRADQIQIALGVVLQRFEVTGESLEEPAGTA